MTHYFDRMLWAKQHIAPVECKYAIVWEDPNEPDEPPHVTKLAPQFLGEALHGGIHPPIGAYIRDKRKLAAAGVQDFRAVGGAEHPYAIPVGPMTEEEAVEYVILKDLPEHVVSYSGNRTVLKIVPIEALPAQREYRGAWTMKQEVAQ